MFMMTIVLVRLQMSKCPWFLGKISRELIGTSLPRALKVKRHSVVLIDHRRMLPSLEALRIW